MRIPAALVLALGLLGIGPDSAPATDHLLIGTKLVARVRAGRAKFVWVSKDTLLVFPAVAPSVAGAVLSVTSSDGDTKVLTLGSGSWSEPATGTQSKYVNRDAPAGDSPCRMAVIREPRFVKVTCKDDLIDTLDAGPEGGIAVRLDVGSDSYCTSFGGVVRDEEGRFLARHAPAPLACQPPPTTTTTTSTTTLTTVLQCSTTTTIPQCSLQLTCGIGQCPPGQSCMDDGGGCGCVGPPVPCGDVGHAQLCGLGECPAGMQCVSTYQPPFCEFACACQPIT